jgi:RNA polymerase sigma-70 factor (ECF subfamily)
MNDGDQHLSQLTTLWSVVRQAGLEQAAAALDARQRLLERYGGAVRRYLRGIVNDREAAEDLFQEFAVRVLQGDLRGADPNRGRFRQYVKGVLFHLTADFHRKQQRNPRVLPPEELPAQAAPEPDQDQALADSWRDELLARAWADLAAVEGRTGQPMHAVLRYRADHPEASSAAMATALSAQLGRALTAANVRQILHRARTAFAAFLVEEVRHSLADPTPQAIEDELIELRLHQYAQQALGPKAGEGGA